MNQTGPLSALLSTASVGDDPGSRDRAFEEVMRLLTIFVRGSMGARLRNQRESLDVCQTVARSLVADLQHGRLSFPSEAALVAYLQTVVRSKLAELSRRDGALKRGGGHAVTALGSRDAAADDFDPTASVHAAEREDAQRVMTALSEEEQDLIRMRRSGLEWEQIAAHTGRSSAALRKEWSRLVARVEGLLDAGPDEGARG